MPSSDLSFKQFWGEYLNSINGAAVCVVLTTDVKN